MNWLWLCLVGPSLVAAVNMTTSEGKGLNLRNDPGLLDVNRLIIVIIIHKSSWKLRTYISCI